MFKLNNKGFTLVELLAVIVVLAIIMIIAIPSVMETMENARKGTFKIYAQKVLTKAEETFQSDILLGNIDATGSTCYDFTKLGLTRSGNYRGKVSVTYDDQLKPTFKLWLSDNSYSVNGIPVEEAGKIGAETGGPTLGTPWIGNLNEQNITCP